jgi:hypothetical protein
MGIFYDTNGKTLADKLVLETFEDAKYEAREYWANEMNDRMQYYLGCQEQVLEPIIHNQYPAVYDLMKPYFYLNFYKKIIDASATVYIDQPTRTLIEGSEAEQELLDSIYEKALFNRKIKVAERYAAMFMTTFVNWRFDSFNQKMILDNIAPYCLDVVQGDFDPTDLNDCQAVRVALPEKTDTQGQTLRRWQLWTAGREPLGGKPVSIVYDENNGVQNWPDEYNNPDWENTYIDPVTNTAIYPLIKLDHEEPVEFFNPGGDDILAACKNLDLRMIDLMYGAKMQAFSIPVLITGPTLEGPTKKSFDPGLILWLQQQGDAASSFHFETPNPKLQELLDMVVTLIELIGKLKNADPTSLNVGKSEQPASGYALWLQKGPMLKARRDRLEYWRTYEDEIARKAMIVWNTHSPDGSKFSDKCIAGGVRVDFADPSIDLDPVQEIEIDRLKQEDGLISIVDRMRKINPDLSEDEAKKRLLEIKALNEEINPKPKVAFALPGKEGEKDGMQETETEEAEEVEDETKPDDTEDDTE